MSESKLAFGIQEIPEGKSERTIALESGDLIFEEGETGVFEEGETDSGTGARFRNVKLKQAELAVSFEKTAHFINVDFRISAVLIIVCDRSLEKFEYPVKGSYTVLFKPEVEAVSEGENSKVKQFDSHDSTLNIGKEVRDTVLLELPVKKLHPRFLDEQGKPVDFETRVFGKEETGDGNAIDPRWEALKKLKKN
ncbi:MAG: DUF177 domain-containing protein [Balneolaceae bacterium]